MKRLEKIKIKKGIFSRSDGEKTVRCGWTDRPLKEEKDKKDKRKNLWIRQLESRRLLKIAVVNQKLQISIRPPDLCHGLKQVLSQ